MLFIPRSSLTYSANNLPTIPSGTPGGSIVHNAAAHTKGNYTEILASAAEDIYWVHLLIVGTGNTALVTHALLDIAIGAAGSEQVIAPNLMVGWAFNDQSLGGRPVSFPLFIPKGSRIAARAQGSFAGDTWTLAASFQGAPSLPGHPIFTGMDAIGVDTATSSGVSITSGDTGAEGSWTNVGSVTARDYDALMFLVHGVDTAMAESAYHFDVGAGSEKWGEYLVHCNNGEGIVGPWPAFPILRHVPAGTQLQVRGTCETSGANNEALQVGLYGLY